MITCDRGLAEMGAARQDPNGHYVMRTITPGGQRRLRLRTLPEELGDVRAASEPIDSQNWGRIYLIRLRRPVAVSGTRLESAWESGKRDEDEW